MNDNAVLNTTGPIRTRAVAVMDAEPHAPGQYKVIDVLVDRPRSREVLVHVRASGLCHSDDHIARGSRRAMTYPFILGHEGAGVIVEKGPDTLGYEVGDHVAFSFIAVCGRCRWCAQGLQNLCDRGRLGMVGSRFDDAESFRVHLEDGRPVGQLMGVGTFTEYTTVDVDSIVKVPKDIPFGSLALLSCGVGSGFGSAVNAADVRPGQAVIVMGVGGVGIHAVQGARRAGGSYVVAVDPVEAKREAALTSGATHVFASMQEANTFVKSVTDGAGADSVIVTVGVLQGPHIAEAFAATRKAGTIVLTAVGSDDVASIPISPNELVGMQKRIQGALFGMSRPTWDIPAQVEMWRRGELLLDQFVTKTYPLEQISQGYDDMHHGRVFRGAVVFDED